MGLLTTQYDPNSAAWVQGAIQLSEELQQRRQAAQERQREFEETQKVAKLQSARIAAAAAQKLAFDQANVQADNARADRRLAIEEELNKPWTPPQSPSAAAAGISTEPSIPAATPSAPGRFEAGGSPARGGFSMSGRAPSYSESVTAGSGPFTLEATGYHPSDVKTGKEARMEGGNVDAQGNPIHTLEDFQAGRAPHVTVAVPQGSPLFGKTLTSPDAPGVNFRASDHFGTLGGKPVEGPKIDVATSSRGTASAITGPMRFELASESPSQRLLSSATELSHAGLPVTNKAIRAAVQKTLSATPSASRSEENLFDTPKELLEKYPNATPVFDPKSGKLRPKFPDATAIAQEDPHFTDIKTKFENVSGLRVNPDDPNEVWKPSYDARGRPSFSRVNDVHRMQDGDLLIVHPSGETERISAPKQKISGTDIKRFQDIEGKISETEGSLSSAYVKAHPEAAASVTQELSMLKKQREKWLTLKPALGEKAPESQTSVPAATRPATSGAIEVPQLDSKPAGTKATIDGVRRVKNADGKWEPIS